MHRIFFAHPDPKLTALYQSYLSPHLSFDSAHNGLMALRKVRVFSPHIIVSAYELPMLSGLSLLKYVRGHQKLHSIPFLFFSDYQNAALALSFGANDWIDRKTQPQALLDKISHHLKVNHIFINHL